MVPQRLVDLLPRGFHPRTRRGDEDIQRPQAFLSGADDPAGSGGISEIGLHDLGAQPHRANLIRELLGLVRVVPVGEQKVGVRLGQAQP